MSKDLDRIIVGNIITMANQTPFVEAAGIKDGVIAALGSVESLMGKAGEMWGQFGPLFDQYNLFICPTITGKGVSADFDYDTDEVQINGKTVDPLMGWFMTHPFNILSRCPVLSVPTGKASNNVPTGM